MTFDERFCAHFHFCFFLYNGINLLYNGVMKNFRDVCQSSYFLIALQFLLSIAIAAGAIFYTYANVIIYCLWKVVLIDVTFVLCCGVLFAFAYFEKHPDCKAWHLLFPFVVGAGVFAALFFGAQAIASSYVNPTVCRMIGVSVALAFTLACVVAQDIFAVKRDRKFLRLLTVLFAIGVYVGAMALSALTLPHGWLFKSLSKDKNEFATASAEVYQITAADRNAGKAWLTEGLFGETPAFDFLLEGKRFTETLSSWTAATVTSETDGEGNMTLVRTYTHSSGVEARVEGKYYDQTAMVEWTVYVTNRGPERSAILSDLHPLEATIPVSASTIYFSGGSNEANDDFALYSRKLGKNEYVFDTVNGRASKLYLPFFNLCGKEGGATIGIGWSGQWTATFSGGKNAKVCVGQSRLEGYLDPGETVRSPLVSLCLYEGGNALKGFNNFRADIKRGLGDRAKESNMLMFAGAEGQDDTSRSSIEGTKEYVAKLVDLGLVDEIDYAWYDAGWYDTKGTGDWRSSVGDWGVDTAKYPDGFGAVSAYLGGYGVKSLLWYEPERVPTSSKLYQTVSESPGKENWLLYSEKDGDCLWNMGDTDACAYMADRIAASLIENGVAYYRQDFNVDPKAYWEYADRSIYDLRKGFAENKYVTGEYAFLDGLRERIPELLIDNCASGGRRIDLEMCRRSVPLWRSDYQCKKEKSDLSEAAQYQTYGLGMWLPYSCITNPNASSEYDFRSLLGGCVMCYADVLFDATEEYVKFIREYNEIKTYFAQNYYPLTSCTPLSSYIAMQFGGEQEGVVLAYVRAQQVKNGKKIKVYPNGLSSDKRYEFRTIEGETITVGQGKEIMQNGIEIQNLRNAYIITYHEA